MSKSFAPIQNIRRNFLLDDGIDVIVSILATNSNDNTIGCLNNCTNNGNCLKYTKTNYKCECDNFHIGSDCYIDINMCHSGYCLNNGECIPRRSDLIDEKKITYTFECKCPFPYYGVNCENIIDLCSNETCSNHGFCMQNNANISCECFLYFSGVNCEFEEKFLITAKKIISTSTVLSIIIIIFIILLMILSDILDYTLRYFDPLMHKKVRKMANKKKDKK